MKAKPPLKPLNIAVLLSFIMNFQELETRFNTWSEQLPYLTETNINDTQIDTDLALTAESIKEQETRFQEFIPKENYSELASQLAAVVDNERTQVADLDEHGMPKDIFCHKGARDGDYNEGDKVLNSILKFFEALVCWGYKHQDEKEIQAGLQNFVVSIYNFLEQVYRESKSLASYLNVKDRVRNVATHIAESILEPHDEEFHGVKREVSDYARFIDSSFIGDELNTEKLSLASYGASINSFSNAALLDPFASVDYRHLYLVQYEIDDEISKALESETAMASLKQKFRTHSRNIDAALRNFSAEKNQYQYSLIWFIAVREFLVECKEDYSSWADFRERMQAMYVDAIEDEEC